eukprot:gene5083-5184_t
MKRTFVRLGPGSRAVAAFHERTKHSFGRLARGPGHLDWSWQPDPFRTFDAPEEVFLCRSPADHGDPPYKALYSPTLTNPLHGQPWQWTPDAVS